MLLLLLLCCCCVVQCMCVYVCRVVSCRCNVSNQPTARAHAPPGPGGKQASKTAFLPHPKISQYPIPIPSCPPSEESSRLFGSSSSRSSVIPEKEDPSIKAKAPMVANNLVSKQCEVVKAIHPCHHITRDRRPDTKDAPEPGQSNSAVRRRARACSGRG